MSIHLTPLISSTLVRLEQREPLNSDSLLIPSTYGADCGFGRTGYFRCKWLVPPVMPHCPCGRSFSPGRSPHPSAGSHSSLQTEHLLFPLCLAAAWVLWLVNYVARSRLGLVMDPMPVLQTCELLPLYL